MNITKRAGLSASLLVTGYALCGAVWADSTPATHGPVDVKHASPKKLKEAPAPHARLNQPPSLIEQKYHVQPSQRMRLDLIPPSQRVAYEKRASIKTVTPACQDMNTLAAQNSATIADYVASLPDYECIYGAFSLSGSQAARVYSAANFNAVASRFAQEAASYHSSDIRLVNLTLYLRAGYYLNYGGTLASVPDSVRTTLRPAINTLVNGAQLFAPNPSGPTTAGEVMTLITNMGDEPYFVDSMKNVVARFTNSASNPNAAKALLDQNAGGGYTGALVVFFRAHSSATAPASLQTDPSYASTLYAFVKNDKAALLGTSAAYQIDQTANEAFRFMKYPALLPAVRPMVQETLNTSTMKGADGDLWLAAAQAVDFYDSSNCAQYGTCNYKTDLGNWVLSKNYVCPDSSVHLRTQELNQDQANQSCNLLANEKPYFMSMVGSSGKPVSNDNNTSLEVVVFSSNADYDKYSPILFGNSTDNGGIYLEGDPSAAGNQARFIAFEATWLRPTFQVWNLGHEYIHYLDGRFDMAGDFSTENQVPVVWWLEGLAEYMSLKNNDQTAITAANTGQYALSTIFQNTYSMNDYVNRAYYWGYMAVRFVYERHPEILADILPKFRSGDYAGFNTYMLNIGTRYDAEFANWVKSAGTTGTPPVPNWNPALPPCPNYYLGNNCSISNLSSSNQTYSYIIVPAGTKSLKIWTSGGSGDVDMYIAKDHYPSTSSFDFSSTNSGNGESITISNPVSGHWYYILLNARQPFSGVSISASYQ